MNEVLASYNMLIGYKDGIGKSLLHDWIRKLLKYPIFYYNAFMESIWLGSLVYLVPPRQRALNKLTIAKSSLPYLAEITKAILPHQSNFLNCVLYMRVHVVGID